MDIEVHISTIQEDHGGSKTMTNGKTICTVCNYIYDEAVGEPRQNISSAIKFDDLNDAWQCPECNSAKEMFQPCSCVSLPIYEATCVAHSTDKRAMTAVGELVAEHPERACVFESVGIDYCCGGKLTLEQACEKKGILLEEVLAKLRIADQKQQPSGTDWTKAPLKDLVAHIVTVYHDPLRTELIRVAQLAEKVARVHGDNHPEMVEVRNIFSGLKAQMELHMQKEEMVLFPAIVAMESTGSVQKFGCGGGIEHPIDVMSREHDEAGTALCVIRKLTNDYAPPADACGSFKVLLFSLAQIEAAMHQHVHKENNILFPRALAVREPAKACR
jgi:regulator of cell morphogenesis and NO signaling